MTDKRVTEPLYVRLTAEERTQADKVARDLHYRRTGDWVYKLVMDACQKHEQSFAGRGEEREEPEDDGS